MSAKIHKSITISEILGKGEKKQTRIVPVYGCEFMIPTQGIKGCKHEENESKVCCAGECPLFTKRFQSWVIYDEQKR